MSTETRPVQRGKLAMGAVVFVLLTAGVFWYQFSRVEAGAAGPTWDDLRWGYFALLLLCLPIETLACGLRIWAMARVFMPGVRLWTCIKAEWANVAVSTLTPTQSGARIPDGADLRPTRAVGAGAHAGNAAEAVDEVFLDCACQVRT